MNINIDKPYQLEIKLVEIEDHLPSFKVLLSINSNHLKGKIVYETSVWFKCDKWDDFENQLSLIKDHKVDEAVLNDLSNDVELKIYRKSHSLFFNVVIKSFLDDGTAFLNMTSTINDDTFGHFYEKIIGVEKWW